MRTSSTTPLSCTQGSNTGIGSSGYQLLLAFTQGGVIKKSTAHALIDQYHQKDGNHFHAAVIMEARKRLGRGPSGLKRFNTCFQIGMNSIVLYSISTYP